MFKDFLDLVKEQSEVDQDTTFATTGRVCAHVQSRSLGAVHAMATSTEGQRTQHGEKYDGPSADTPRYVFGFYDLCRLTSLSSVRVGCVMVSGYTLGFLNKIEEIFKVRHLNRLYS